MTPTSTQKKEDNKRVQANVNRKVAAMAESVINELGLTPTAVINALYKKIAATGEIPFSFKLTEDQMADIKLQAAIQNIPEHKIRTKKQLEEFFDED